MVLRVALTGAGLFAAPSAWAQSGEGPLNQADYQLSARVVNDRTIEGTARIRWVHRSARPTRELWWHLYLNAFANHESLFFRTLAAQGHRGHPPGRSGSITVHRIEWVGHSENLLAASTLRVAPNFADTTQLHTDLPEEIPANSEVELNVSFTSVLPDASARTGCGGGYCFAAQWFPKLAVLERDGEWSHFALHANSEFYADFGRYELTVDTASSVSQAGPGESRALPSSGPARAVREYILSSAHDISFEFSSMPRSQRTMLVRGARGEIRVSIVFPPLEASSAERALVSVSRAIPELESRFGPYPYDQLMIVLPPHEAEGTGGMEYPGLITIDSQPGLPAMVREIEYVTIHELAHQWFYGLLASNENAFPFLDEGFTEYATGVVMDALYGRPSLFRLGGLGVDFWAIQGGFAASESTADPLSFAAYRFQSFSHYSNTVYRRTAAVLHSVEQDDPAAVRGWLRAYATQYRGRHPTPTDLLATLDQSSVSPQNKSLLRAIVQDGGRFDLRVSELDAQHTTLIRDGALHPEVSVELLSSTGAVSRVRWNTSDSPHRINGSYRTVRIDPEHHWALDDNHVNNERTLSASPIGPFLFRASTWVGLLLRWIGP